MGIGSDAATVLGWSSRLFVGVRENGGSNENGWSRPRYPNAHHGLRWAMAEYLLIESRDPFESNDVGYYYDLARGLAEAGNGVTLFLVQNAVFTARPSAEAPKLRALASSGVKILADDFALRERGITKLSDSVQAAPIEIVVDRLEAGHKA